jgi:type IV secretory pathway TrbF-like protein
VSEKRVNWQSISALSLIGSMIDSLLDEMENHYANLQACRLKPYVLDNDTVGRVIDVYSAQADDVWLFETQLYR